MILKKSLPRCNVFPITEATNDDHQETLFIIGRAGR